MNVPLEFSIIDNRTDKDFKIITFSGYKKLDVIKQFEKALLNNNLEIACNWLIELHISGKMDNIWQIIFQMLSKNININNPYLSSWIWLKYNKYQTIMRSFKKGYEYESRNNQEIRNLLIDIIVILTFSKKSDNLTTKIKISDNDLKQINYRKKIKYQRQDRLTINQMMDIELKIALNEILNLINNGDIKEIIYWYNWIEKIEKLKKNNKIEFITPITELKYVNKKYFNDWIWIIWKYLLYNIDNNKIYNEIISLYHLYLIKYTSLSRNKKQYILFHAILFLKSNINWNIPLIYEYKYRIQACCNINQFYKLKKLDNELYLDKYQINNNKNDEKYYQKISEIIKPKSEINIKTSTKKKPIKIEDKVDDKNNKKIMKKLEYFDKLIFYKLDKEVIDENRKTEIADLECKNIKI